MNIATGFVIYMFLEASTNVATWNVPTAYTHTHRGNLAYETNYCAGLRVLDVTDIKAGKLNEVGFFDVAPDCNSPGFHGSWSNYPYFESGTIIVSSIERGLFVLRYTGSG